MMNLIKILSLTLIACVSCFAVEAASKPLAEDIFDKAVEANAGDAIKAYSDYQTKLDAATKKVLAALENAKKDLNDTKKGKWSLTERADAIKAIDERIAAIKKDGVGEAVVGKVVAKADLLGEAKVDGVKIVGKWACVSNDGKWAREVTFKKDTFIVSDGRNGNWQMLDGKINMSINGSNWMTINVVDGVPSTYTPAAGSSGTIKKL